MRHLIVCCDGTWQRVDQPTPTNVCRLYKAIAPQADDGTEQVPQYFDGVGANGSLWDKVTGGLTGAGLSRAVRDAYRWLVCEYRPATGSPCSASAAAPTPPAAWAG